MHKSSASKNKQGNENQSPSESKRLKFNAKNKDCLKYLEGEDEQNLLEQMGLGLLEEDSSSSSSENIKLLDSAEFVEIPEIEAENINTKTPKHFEVYSDCESRIKRIMSSNNQHKGRSPLAIVSNNKNNNVQQQQPQPSNSNDESIKKYLSVVNEERFFLYRKRQPKAIYGQDVFSKLSDEIILQVFKWLPKKTLIRCSQVSLRFNRVARDETLWTRLDLAGRCLGAGGAVGKVISRGVVILRLAQTEIIDPIFEDDFDTDFQSKLQYLDLSMCVISKQSLRQLLLKCRNLKKLSLESVPVDAMICHEIAANVNLEALNLTMSQGIETLSIRLMMKNLKKLQSLNISWTSLSRQSIEAFVTNVTPKLLRLNIAGCRKTMTDVYLKDLVTRCPELCELDLSDCTQLTSDAIGIVCKLKKLEYLSLSRCYSINVASYLQLSELQSLLYLDVFGLLSEQAITMLQNSFPNVGINKFMHSSVARPTVGTRRTSIWGLRTRD